MNLRTWWIIGGVATLAAGLVAACSSSSDSPAAAAGGSGGEGGEEVDAKPDVTKDTTYEAPPPCPNAPEAVDCTAYEGGVPLKDDAIYAINYIYSDRGRDRQPSPDAYKSYGFDLDGKVSTPTSADHCKLVDGADPNKIKNDLPSGIDNAFAAVIAPIVHEFDKDGEPTWVDNWTTGIVKGGPTIVLRLPDLKLPPAGDAGVVDAGPHPDGGFQVGAPPPNPGPLTDAGTPQLMKMLGYTTARLCDDVTWLWDSPHQLPVDFASTACGDVDKPTFAAPQGSLTGDYWYSGKLDDATMIVPIKGAALHVHLKQVQVSMYLSADRKMATMGTLGGIANTDEFIANIESVRGFIATIACPKFLFDTYAVRMRQASDIMDDGTQDPNQTCNGISLGMGFDAARVEIGSLVTLPVPKDPCPAAP